MTTNKLKTIYHIFNMYCCGSIYLQESLYEWTNSQLSNTALDNGTQTSLIKKQQHIQLTILLGVVIMKMEYKVQIFIFQSILGT